MYLSLQHPRWQPIQNYHTKVLIRLDMICASFAPSIVLSGALMLKVPMHDKTLYQNPKLAVCHEQHTPGHTNIDIIIE